MRGLSGYGDGAAVTTGTDSLRSGIRDKSMVAVDARHPEEYGRMHIPGARNLPLSELLSDDSPERVAKLAGSLGIDDGTHVVVYDDTFGALASRIAWTLEYIGHSKVTLLETTFGRWQSMGLEADSGQVDASPKKHGAKTAPDIVATHDYLEQAVRARDDVTLLDNRERLNFLEQHIPGAMNIPYRTLAGADTILRGRGDMGRLFGNRGITRDSEIITYCGSVGTLSGLAYYALKSAGFSNVRLYVRSFREWKSLQKPIEKQQDANYWDLSAE